MTCFTTKKVDNFFSVVTKNSNCEILTKNLKFKVKMEFRIKNFNIWAFTEKSDFQRGDFTKNQ